MEINTRLKREGYAPVSPPMYEHYRKLQRYRYDLYIPINQLDVKTLEDPVWDRATKNRYVGRDIRIPVHLKTPTIPSESWEGIATLISDGVLVVRLSTTSPQTFVKLAKQDALFEVLFPDTGEIRSA